MSWKTYFGQTVVDILFTIAFYFVIRHYHAPDWALIGLPIIVWYQLCGLRNAVYYKSSS